uniref:RECA_2 domain-containing protein n=1 Tax=Steinernema glaseri TaxID=37863 RepID=A0A1I8AX65_9BILA
MNEDGLEEETALEALVRLGHPDCSMSCGDQDMDSFLRAKSGLVPCEVTEVVGDTAAGKSQFCLSVMASFLRDPSKTSANIAFIDSNGSFRASRLLQILQERWDVTRREGEDLLKRVFVRRVSASADLSKALSELLLEADSSGIQLLIVDSIGGALSDTLVDYLGSGQSVQMSILDRMKKVADAGRWVLVVNHLVYWRSSPTPALGYRWINDIANRILITTDDSYADVHWMQVFPHRKMNDDRVAVELTAAGVKCHAEATQTQMPAQSQIMSTFLMDLSSEGQ